LRLEDITPQTNLISSNQPEAAQNLRGARTLQVDPTYFKNEKDTLEPEIKKLMYPEYATPIVASKVRQSSEHAGAIAPEATKYSDFERIIGNTANAIKRKTGDDDTLAERGYEAATSGTILGNTLGIEYNEDKEFERQSLKADSKSNFGMTDYGPATGWEKVVAETSAQVADFGAMTWRNKELIGKITAGTMGANAAVGGLLFGPVGVATGLSVGAAQGLGVALPLAFFYDGYKKMTGATYNDLDDALDDQGNPLNIDQATKQQISHGVGVVSGAIGAVVDRLTLGNVPWIKKYLSGKAGREALKNPLMKEAFIGIGKSMMTGGAGEILDEITSIIGEEIGGTYKESEVDFQNGVLNAWSKIKTKEGLERVGYAGVIGATSGGVITGALTTPQMIANKLKKSKAGGIVPIDSEYTTPNYINTHKDVVDVLNFQDVFDGTSKMLQGSDLNTHAPEEALAIIKESFPPDQRKVWVDVEYIKSKLSTSPEKLAALEQAMDPEGAPNAPRSIDIDKALAISATMPEISEYLALQAGKPDPRSAKVYAERLDAVQAKRDELKAKLDVGQKTPQERALGLKLEVTADDDTIAQALGTKEVAEEYLKLLNPSDVEPENRTKVKKFKKRVQLIQNSLPDDVTANQTIQQALDTPEPINDVFGEEDFLKQPNFTPLIEGVVGESEIKSLNEADQSARQKIVDNINETSIYEMNEIVDQTIDQATEAEFDTALDTLKPSYNTTIVDKFATPITDVANSSHTKPGFSQYAIDFSSLTPEQKKLYSGNERLKKNKIFVKGGLKLDSSAKLIGVNSGDYLLKLLSETPSSEELIQARVEAKAADIKQQATDSVDLNDTAIVQAYRESTVNTLKKMAIIWRESQAAVKRGIKRIAFLPPRIEELTRRATEATQQTKVGDLNPKRFNAGERKSHRLALKHWLDGAFLKAYTNYEAAALNSELQIATHKAIAEVNRVLKAIKRMERADVTQELTKAGIGFINARDEIMGLFNFNPNKKDVVKQGAYGKFVQAQVKNGVADFSIMNIDVKESVNDLTVAEIKAIGNALKGILHAAREANTLALNKEMGEVQQISDSFHAEAIKNPDYEVGRSDEFGSELVGFQKNIANVANHAIAVVKNMEAIIEKIDGKINGLLKKLIIDPLHGIGKFANQGYSGKLKDKIFQDEYMKKAIAIFGEKEWKRLAFTVVNVPEFKGTKITKTGDVSKADLFVMMLNSGNEENIRRMAEGYGVDESVIHAVLERELDGKYSVMAQQIWDLFNTYWSRVVKLHQETTGITPEKVDAVPFTHRGKVVRGGYFPLIGKNEFNTDRLKTNIDKAQKAQNGEILLELEGSFYADQMTKTNHTKARTGTTEMISLSLNNIELGLEMIVHDLNFRKPIGDALKLLKEERIAEDIKNIVGIKDFGVLFNGIVDSSISTQMDNHVRFNSSKLFERMGAKLRSRFAIQQLAYSASSVLIQPVSLFYAVRKMGGNSIVHLSNVLSKIFSNPEMYSVFTELASEIHPQVKAGLANIDDNAIGNISKMMSQPIMHEKLHGLREFRDKWFIDKPMKILSDVDQFMKIIVTSTAYLQFMAGDVEGYGWDKIGKMSEQERDQEAKTYASSIARTTLTSTSRLDKSEAQKISPSLTMFYNDSRNILNESIREIREIKNKVKKAEYESAAIQGMGFLLVGTMAKMYYDLIRGNALPTDDWEENKEWFKANPEEFAKQIASYLGSGILDRFLGNIPIVREVYHTTGLNTKMEPWQRLERVSNVYTQMQTDVSDTLTFALDAMGLIESEFDYRKAKALANTLSTITGVNAPINGAFKLYKILEDINPDQPFAVTGLVEEFLQKYRKFKDENADNKEIPPELWKDLDALESQFEPEVDKTQPGSED